ncbi:putative ribonuclease H-like domain-containing protein [Tanacetum coccineum]
MSKNLEEHGFVSTIQQRTNHKDLQNYLFACFLSQEEPKKVIHALKDPSWIEAIQEELLQFKLQEVSALVDLPYGKRAIGTKWVFKNKKDEGGIMIRNKARLVAQGYTQEEGIDYDEVFAPVAKIEAIRLFLAYASFKDFVVYQMDVKSAFLYGKIEEEVYVCQPLVFEDPDFPDRVYKVEKALYGLHQAPRAWYETLSTYLLDNEFQRGKINKTLLIKRYKGDILLVQVYVDDIIFGLTKKELCNAFEKLMHEKFQMSSMGELTFFLGLQVKQKKDGIFISQDKYVEEILKKFGFTEVKTASTPIETQKPLLKDEDGEEVDVHMYRSMIGSLMYLTSSRPDIMFAVCAYARYQVNPKVSHLYAVKRIFRYLKGQPKLGLWYPKDSPFDLVAYTICKKQTVVANSTTEAEYVAASSCCRQVLWIQNQLLDYGHNLLLGYLLLLLKVNAVRHNLLLLVMVNADEEQFWSTVKAKTINREVQLQALVDAKKIIITESTVRRDIQLEDAEGVDCLPNATIFKQLALMGYEQVLQKLTFYKAFFSQQRKFLIHTILQCLSAKTTVWKEFSSTMASAIICLATNQKFNFSKYIFESMVKNLENVYGKFLMYPRFVQVFLDQQLEGMSSHNRIYVTPSHTKKIFGNMRRVEKDKAVYKELDDSLVRAATIASSLEAEQDSSGGPRRQETMGDTITQTRFENVSKLSNDPLLAKVLALETTKTTQANEIAGLKRRVKKLERRNKSSTHRLKRLYKVDIYLVNVHTDEDMFGVNDLDGDEVIVDNVDVVEEVTAVIVKAKLVSAAEEIVNVAATTVSTASTIPVSTATNTNTTTTIVSDVEITLAQALAELKSAKLKADKVMIQEPEQGITITTLTITTTAITQTTASTRPKVKGIVIHKQEQAPTPTVSSQQPSQVKV